MNKLVTALKEVLLEDVFQVEPRPGPEGIAPVVAWARTFHNTATYSYAAIGIGQPGGTLLWYITNDDKPRTWDKLTKFMSTSGIATLEILRAGEVPGSSD